MAGLLAFEAGAISADVVQVADRESAARVLRSGPLTRLYAAARPAPGVPPVGRMAEEVPDSGRRA